jgi:hypothetical protein
VEDVNRKKRMAKRNLKKEKALRNEVFAKLHKKEREEEKKRIPTYANWCRVPGHPSSCSCILPSKDEVVAVSRVRR